MGEVLLLALVYGLRWGLIIVGMFAMPLILVLALVGPHPRLRQLGSTLAWQFVGLLVMTWPVAFMMRLGYELQWGFSTSGLANFVLSLAMLAVGLVIPLVISISLLRAPPSITAIAAGATGAAASLSLREDEDDYSTDDYDSDSSSGGGSGGDSGSGGDAASGPSPGIEPYSGPTPSERIAVVIAGTQAPGPHQPHTVAAGAGTTDSPQRVTARDVIDVPQRNDGNDAVTAGDRLGQRPTSAAMDGTTRSHQGRDQMSPADASTPTNTGASGTETPSALPEPTYVPSSSEPPTGDDDAVTTAERKREQTRDGAASEEASTLEQRRRLHSGTDEPPDRTNATPGETDASSSNTSDAATDSSPSTAATDRTESDISFTRTHDGPSTLSDERWAALKRRYGDGVDDTPQGDTDTTELAEDDRDGGQEGESR
ncbi:hypothetical protein [Halococcus salifodinae]|nr:hypothetical protein [Halococcus salifodinae]